MPLVLPAKYDMDRGVTQSAYEWVLTEQTHACGQGPGTHEYYFASGMEAQMELFSGEPIVDEYFLFQNYVDQWHAQRSTMSSTTEMILCPAYQSIIGMGPKAVGLILAQLASEQDPDHWFWALQVLTGANPVPNADEGNLGKMAKAWLDWAAAKGYAI